MRCLFYSYCDEPRHLCCNFCSNTKCEIRCKDDHTKCKLYEEGNVEIEDKKPNHIIGKIKRKKIKLQYKQPQIDIQIKRGRGRPKKIKSYLEVK